MPCKTSQPSVTVPPSRPQFLPTDMPGLTTLNTPLYYAEFDGPSSVRNPVTLTDLYNTLISIRDAAIGARDLIDDLVEPPRTTHGNETSLFLITRLACDYIETQAGRLIPNRVADDRKIIVTGWDRQKNGWMIKIEDEEAGE